MEDLLIEVLSRIGYPVRLQGSFLANEGYPDSFFTFWNNSSDFEEFYDDIETEVNYVYEVNFYSTDPEKVYNILEMTVEALKDNSFTVDGEGHSVVSDEPTHNGRGIGVSYRKEI